MVSMIGYYNRLLRINGYIASAHLMLAQCETASKELITYFIYNTVTKQDIGIMRSVFGMGDTNKSEYLTQTNFAYYGQLVSEISGMSSCIDTKPTENSIENTFRNLAHVYSYMEEKLIFGGCDEQLVCLRLLRRLASIQFILQSTINSIDNGLSLSELIEYENKLLVKLSSIDRKMKSKLLTQSNLKIIRRILSIEDKSKKEFEHMWEIKTIKFKDTRPEYRLGIPSMGNVKQICRELGTELGKDYISNLIKYYKSHFELMKKELARNPGSLIVTEDFKDNAYLAKILSHNMSIKIFDRQGELSRDYIGLSKSVESPMSYTVVYWNNDTGNYRDTNTTYTSLIYNLELLRAGL